jgi:probable rRNA maturation factor
VPAGRSLQGEIYISMDAAVAQARQFRTTWQAELVRYVIHGLLHLAGHDDQRAPARRRMKREEDRLLRGVARQFSFKQLAAAGS